VNSKQSPLSADPNGRSFKGVGMQPLDYRDCGFESRRGSGLMFVSSECWVLSRRGICWRLTIQSMWCVWVWSWSHEMRRPWSSTAEELIWIAVTHNVRIWHVSAMLHVSLLITTNTAVATAILILPHTKAWQKFLPAGSLEQIKLYLFTELCFVPYMNPWFTYHEGPEQHRLHSFAIPCRTGIPLSAVLHECETLSSSQRGGTQYETVWKHGADEDVWS
jgi:hypothetical protein